MPNKLEKFRATMLEKFNGDEEALKEYYRSKTSKAGSVKNPNKGFARLDKETLKKVSAKGVEARRAKRDERS